jgi:hypothetical protein
VFVRHVRMSESGAVAAPMVDQWTTSNPCRPSRSIQLGDRFTDHPRGGPFAVLPVDT